MKKIFFLACACVVVATALFFHDRATEGFSLRQIIADVPFNPDYEVETKTAEIAPLFDQPFHYLGKGCQTYAFESADEKYVLKFFKQKHLRPPAFLQHLPLPTCLKELVEAKIRRREERADSLFSSCKICYEYLQDQTFIVALHLNTTPVFNKKVILVDKMGWRHQIALDDVQFVLQKKGLKIEQLFFDDFMARREDGVRKKLSRLVQLVVECSHKGILDYDRAFAQNVAFESNDGPAFFVDIGKFHKDEKMKTEENTKAYLLKRLLQLRYWSEKRCPMLTSFIDEEMEKHR